MKSQSTTYIQSQSSTSAARFAAPVLALLASVGGVPADAAPRRVILLTGLNHHNWAMTAPR